MRLNREPAFPKRCDFWMSQGRQLLLGVVTNWALWEMLLTGHAVLEQEERSLKPLGVFPGLPMQEKIPFSPGEICSPSTQPLGKKEGRSHHGVGWQTPCPTSGYPTAPRGLLTRQGGIPRRKGLIPSGPCKAAECRSLEDALRV